MCVRVGVNRTISSLLLYEQHLILLSCLELIQHRCFLLYLHHSNIFLYCRSKPNVRVHVSQGYVNLCCTH